MRSKFEATRVKSEQGRYRYNKLYAMDGRWTSRLVVPNDKLSQTEQMMKIKECLKTGSAA